MKRLRMGNKTMTAITLSLMAGLVTSADAGERASNLFTAAGIPSPAMAAETDGTKYGKYITLSVNNPPTERGIAMFPMGGDYPGFSGVIIGRMPPPGPMPSHDAPEKHDGEIEYLIHLGNVADDPLDLGADVDFFLGKGPYKGIPTIEHLYRDDNPSMTDRDNYEILIKVRDEPRAWRIYYPIRN